MVFPELVQFFRHFPFPASLTDARTRFVWVNPAFSDSYRIAEWQIIGLKPGILVPRGRMPCSLAEINSATRVQGWSGVLVNHDAAGREFEIQLQTACLSLRMNPGDRIAPHYLGIAVEPSQLPRFAASVMQSLATILAFSSRTLHEGGLTARETEFVALLGEGLSNKEIAHKLGIAHATARVLCSRARLKLGAEIVPRFRAARGKPA